MASLIDRRKLMALVAIKNWLTPTTVSAIKTEFGDAIGADICNMANEYINALEPTRQALVADLTNEDPMLVCSYLDTGKSRWLVGDGSAWIESGCTITAADYIKIKVIQQTTAAYWSFFGQATSYNSTDAFIYAIRDVRVNCYIGGRVDFGNTISIVLNTPFLFEGDYSFVKVTNLSTSVSSQVSSGASGISATTQTAKIFRGAGSASNLNIPRNWKISFVEIGNKRQMYPFIRENELGMVDFLSGVFYRNAGSGNFTIELINEN